MLEQIKINFHISSDQEQVVSQLSQASVLGSLRPLRVNFVCRERAVFFIMHSLLYISFLV